MAGSKYVDLTAVIQVVGCVYNNPKLLDCTDKYSITEEDFPDTFHQILFGSIYKLYELGAKTITLETISDFLKSRPKSQALYIKQKGEEWLLKASESCNETTFDYYYNRLKKMTLLRAYDNFGIDVKDLYDPDNILDTQKKQIQEDWLDNSSLEKIADQVDNKIENIRMKYVEESEGESYQAGDGAEDLIDKFKQRPEVGVPMYGPLINTVTRGARLKKFYLRSAPTGTGKSRTMVADACYLACDKMYDELIGWINIGPKQPVLFITTEQELEEIQTMMMAFISGVSEEKIL